MSKFEQATSETLEEIVEEPAAFVPRVVFTSDAKIDLAKMEIPLLRLAQGMTSEVTTRKASIGQFVVTGFPAVDEVEIVPFGAQKIRAYKPDQQSAPLCTAPTGEFGIGNPGGECALCPLSKWGPRDPKTGKSTPPRCTEAIMMRGYSLTHRALVDFQFGGRRASKGVFVQQQGMTFGFGGFHIKLQSSSTSNDRGTWYEPEVLMLGDVPADQVDTVAKWFGLFNATLVDTEQAEKALKG